MKVAIYLRVSTDGQTTENQKRELLKVIEFNPEWEFYGVYEDEGISGSKGRDKRPGFNNLIKDATRKKFNMVMAWSIDRLSRSLKDLVTFIEEMQSLNCDLYLHQQAINTSTPAGRALYQMCGVFAEFERAMIQERVKAGLARAKANGKKLGRKKVDKKIEEKIIALRQSQEPQMGILKIAKNAGCGVGTVQRVIKETGL
jgi:DNA invertase Pin-like site-specific DNA recombinase